MAIHAAGRPPPLDLRALALRSTGPARRWRHVIRQLDRRGRLLVPGAAGLGGSSPIAVAATLSADRWELRPACRGQRAVVLDDRNRVLVPVGVRHQLGLDGAVLVSVALDQSLLVVWPASRFDSLLEER